MKLYNGYKRLPRNYTLMTDEYEFTMANGYFENEMQDQMVVFDVFFRKIPNNGGYAIMAGLDKVIEYIENLRFGHQEISYLQRQGYSKEFVKYMKNFKFTGDIYAIPDGTPVFPNEPLLTVKAPIIQAQIIETAILSVINGAMEHATGARRIVEATPEDVTIMEFGARRADGCEAAIDSSIYGIMAGCHGTSNDLAADMLNMKGLGTQAHSWIESYDTEYDAFLAYAKAYPQNCLLLVDTIDTLRSGVPNAIKVAKEYLIPNGYRLKGIRIDSGDLAYLSKKARKMLDDAGLHDAGICLSNGLTAESIESLIVQGAKFTSLGVGDNISKPAGRMGCVYKEVALKKGNVWIPKIKLSNDVSKTINPDFKNLYRAYDNSTGYAIADIMSRKIENISRDELVIVDPSNILKRTTISNFTLEKLQKTIFKDGNLVYDDPEILEKQKYCNEQMMKIYPEIKRSIMPHEYYVDGTEEYVEFKNALIDEMKKMAKSKKIKG